VIDNQFGILCFSLLYLALIIETKLSLRAIFSSIDKSKTTIIFPPKGERKKKEEKKDMPFIQPVKRRLSRFFDKILPDQREVWRFWQKPEGLDLYCR
jgi:hypothetical protein